MKKKGFNIINLTTLEQLCYASNFLCIKDGQILAIEVEREVKNVLQTVTSKAQENPHRYGSSLSKLKRIIRIFKIRVASFPTRRKFTNMA